MTLSQNGYAANVPQITKVWDIPGTERSIRLRADDCGFLLVDLLARFHREVEPIDEGQLDDWGYAERNVRGSDDVVSNHASGTAVDVNALKHPLGARGTFTEEQTRKIRTLLSLYDGCIRWGGDYQRRADEMHFEINKPLDEVERVANLLRRDWLAMATKEEVAALFDERLRAFFGDATNDKNPGLPDIGKARVVHPNSGKVSTLAHLLYGIDAEVRD